MWRDVSPAIVTRNGKFGLTLSKTRDKKPTMFVYAAGRKNRLALRGLNRLLVVIGGLRKIVRWTKNRNAHKRV